MNTRTRTLHLRRALFAALITAFCTARAAIVTSSWTSATSGNWNVDSNWTNVPALGGFPNSGNGGVATYDALIAATGSAYTVTLGTSITVEALTLNSADATLAHTAGTLAANTGLNINAGTYRLSGTGRINNTAIALSGTGGLALAGGTIKGGNITGSSAAGISIPTFNTALFDGVNLGSNLSVANAGTLNVSNGLTLSSNARITLASTGAQTSLEFGSGPQTLGGTGEILLGGSGGSNLLRAQGSGTVASALTIGPDITVRGNGAIAASTAMDSIVTQVTILADTAGGFVFLQGN